MGVKHHRGYTIWVAVVVTSADQVDKTDIKDHVARERLGRVEGCTRWTG